MSDKDRPKPIPVRPPGSSSKAPKRSGGAGGEENPGAAPTPVRDLMGDTLDEESPPAPSLSEAEIPFESEGVRWVARSGGRTRSGTAPDSGAPLLLVLFYRVDEEEGAADEPEREVWAVKHGMDDLTEGEVELLLARSRPFQTVESSRDRRSGRSGRGTSGRDSRGRR